MTPKEQYHKLYRVYRLLLQRPYPLWITFRNMADAMDINSNQAWKIFSHFEA